MSALALLLAPDRRLARAAVYAVILIAALVATVPDAARNLVMLAYLRRWTNEYDAGLTRLGAVSRWLTAIERADPLLQAQASAVAAALGDDDAAAAALERARSFAHIAEQCGSPSAMQIERLARPIPPESPWRQTRAFVWHDASEDAISQMRSVAADDGGSDCVHVLTAALPSSSAAFAAFGTPLPVRPGHRYRISTECFVTGSLQVALEESPNQDRIDHSVAAAPAITAREVWVRTELDTAPQQGVITQVKIVAHHGAGRIACRDITAYDLTAAER